jgi:hypothetical protein
MIPSLDEALVLAARQRVELESFFKFRFRSYRRQAFPNAQFQRFQNYCMRKAQAWSAFSSRKKHLSRNHKGHMSCAAALGRRFDRGNLGPGLSELKLQDPDAGNGLAINLRRLEPPIPRRLQSLIREILARPWRFQRSI